jgi:nifR3 family TIM-barrel protein
MRQATEICAKEKPEFIDINYGCPVKKVANKGAGAGILRDIPKMISMTKEIVRSTNIPVTVKTRLGWDENSKYIVEVAERLQDVGIKAISIHGRTRKQMYKGEADWTLIGEVKNNPKMIIPVFGNGDVDTPEKVKSVQERYGVDGVMIGRGAIGNPWIFKEIKHYLKTNTFLEKPNIQERVNVCKQHLKHSITWKGERVGIAEMKRHYSSYFKAIPDFKQFRTRMVTSNSVAEVLEILNEVQNKFILY